MEYFIFLSQKILAVAVNGIILGIMPLLTLMLAYTFDFEYLIQAQFQKIKHAIASRAAIKAGRKPPYFEQRVYLKDYLPFKLPIGISVIAIGVIFSVGAVGGYMSTPLFNQLNTKIKQSYAQYVEADNAQNPVRTNAHVELHRIRLHAWTPPKHFYVDFTDLTSNQKFERVYVSKHCNRAGELKTGDEFNVPVQVYTLSSAPGKEFREYVNLYGVFCA